jgi:hypothetical protein
VREEYLERSLYNMAKPIKNIRTNKDKPSLTPNKETIYEEDYNELLNDLAEARNAANLIRSETLKDDSSPFNPSLTENDADWVIKKSMEPNNKTKEE